MKGTRNIFSEIFHLIQNPFFIFLTFTVFILVVSTLSFYYDDVERQGDKDYRCSRSLEKNITIETNYPSWNCVSAIERIRGDSHGD